jgi:diacylglycerol kinase family enzyme
VIRLPPETDRVLIVANPKAGAGPGKERVQRLIDSLKRHRLSPELISGLSDIGDQVAATEASGRLRAVVGAGGDGTIAEIINRAPPRVPIAMLPLGTENLLGKYVDMPRSPEEVAEVIAAGSTVLHDAGRACGRLFFLMVSCGFDAEVVRRLHEDRTGHIRHWSYFKPIWQTIRSYEYPELRVYCDSNDVRRGAASAGLPAGMSGRTRTEVAEAEDSSDGRSAEPIRARFAFVFNIPRYAFGFQFAPDAKGDDGLLDVCTFGRGSFGRGLWYLMNVVAGRHHRLADCTMLRARRIRIEADVPVPYNLDGDHCGYLPLDIEIVPKYLTLLVPPGWAEREETRRVAADRVI